MQTNQFEVNRMVNQQTLNAGTQFMGQNQLPLSNIHERPLLELPDAKRVRMNENFVAQQHPNFPVQLPNPTLPVTSQMMEHNAQPPVSSDQTDVEVIQTRLSEADFAKSLPDPVVSISIIIPNDETYASWNFKGQNITVSVDVMTKIKGLKQKLQSQLGDMPLNKMQLKSREMGYLKDASSLAMLNIGNHSPPLELVPKLRGSKK